MVSKLLGSVKACRVCGSENIIPAISLGKLFISDFLDKDTQANESDRLPLDLVLCERCGLLQLKDTVSHEAMYRNYWYRSGVNVTMRNELANITESAEKIVKLKTGDTVLDIGSNDSTLLRSYATQGLELVGFEPATNIVGKYGKEGVNKIFNNFFNYEDWSRGMGGKKAKVITAIAMFYDLEDPNEFVSDIVKCLDDNGLLIIQMLYLPSFLERNAFDGICHEHLEYYSLGSLEALLERQGLEVFDAEYRAINEGSYRFYIRKKGKGLGLTVPPGAPDRVEAMREMENKMHLTDPQTYKDFMVRVDGICKQIKEFVVKEVAAGKKVYVYGASTKGNTLLQYCGLDSSLIAAAAERNPDKWGKKTVGTNIPIISEEDARKANPDYFLILPWHFLEEFRAREEAYLHGTGKFIVPLPEFRIIGTS